MCRNSTNASATSCTQCASAFASMTVTGVSIATVDGGITISSSKPEFWAASTAYS